MPDHAPGPRLETQLCFPLYAASRLVTRMYQEQLAPLGITYPQYVVLMILWEDAPCSVSAIGHRALLNSNTLTPLLKRLQQQGYIQRNRDSRDERQVVVELTEAGRQLERHCSAVPEILMAQFPGDHDQIKQLKDMLDGLVAQLQHSQKE